MNFKNLYKRGISNVFDKNYYFSLKVDKYIKESNVEEGCYN